MIDYYLSDEGKHHLPDINRLAKLDTPEADDKMLHYAMEGIRLNGTFGSYRESHITVTVDDGGRSVDIKPGDKVFVSFVRLSVSYYSHRRKYCLHPSFHTRSEQIGTQTSSRPPMKSASTGLWNPTFTTAWVHIRASAKMQARLH
jgi:hypothetical protein